MMMMMMMMMMMRMRMRMRTSWSPLLLMLMMLMNSSKCSKHSYVQDDGGLVISNRITLNKLTSTCMRVLLSVLGLLFAFWAWQLPWPLTRFPISACKVDVPEELDTLAMEKKLGELTPTEEFVAMLRVSLKQVLRPWLSRLTVGKHCLQGRV